MDLFKNLDIVKILGIGLSGFGFLLRFLAYRLINRIVGTKPDKKVFIIISLYMFVCFIMTVTVGIFTYFTTTYKNTQLTEQSKKLKDNSVALNVLAASHKYDIIGDSIEKIASEYKTIEKYKILVKEAKNEQEKTLDSLSVYFKEDNTLSFDKEFNKNKITILTILDSLQIPNLSKSERLSLLNRYA